jgi:cysteine desulfurase family protein
MIYLDNAATSWPKAPGVVRAVVNVLKSAAGNPGRTSHRSALDAAELIQECRENLAALIGVGNPLRICFTANTTEALNLAIKGVLKPGDHAICSSMEHNSVWRPLVALESSGVELSIAQANSHGVLVRAAVERLIRGNTRLIVLTHASNVNGAIQPVAEVGELARSRGIPFLVDAAQSAGSIPIDVKAMKIDLLAFPGHKGLLGPQGTGGLYVSEHVDLRPLMEGGTGSHSLEAAQPAEFPDRLESGTLNLPGIAGLNCSVQYLLKKGVATVARHEARLTRRLIEGLKCVDGVTVYGPGAEIDRAPAVSFNLCEWDAMAVAEQLESRAGIACRPGWHCAGLAHRTLGTAEQGTVRLSPGPFTRAAEIDAAIETVAGLASNG